MGAASTGVSLARLVLGVSTVSLVQVGTGYAIARMVPRVL